MNIEEVLICRQEQDTKVYNNLIEKINVGQENECWTWNASKNMYDGRPMFWFQGSWTRAARAIMYFKQGYLTKGMHVCHDPIICNNKWCINPFHLREDTPSSNTRDLVITNAHNNARKTHCPRGHEYNEENTYKYKNRRHCLACRRGKETL